jgi:hypothetical protein
MDHRIACAPARPILRAVAVVAATTMLAVAISSDAVAQTPAVPNAQTKLAPPPVTAKSLPTGRAKSCSMYGDGFVYVPATDACIKIGGFVRIEGETNHGH